MGRGRTKVSEPDSRGWDTAGGRVRWLLHELWKGNCSAMARTIGVSHTVINRIDIADREPGRVVLEAVARHTGVNATWVLSGEGEPLVADPQSPRPDAVTVADAPLPGPPGENPDRLSRDSIGATGSFTPKQYWLRLRSGEPILGNPHLGLRPGDLLLFEADRLKFPAIDRFHGQLCAVANPRDDDPPIVLGLVAYHPEYFAPERGVSPAHLEVERFASVAKGELVEQFLVTRHSDGRLSCAAKRLRTEKVRGRTRVVEVEENDLTPLTHTIEQGAIVGVWTGIIRREPDFS